MKKLFRRSLWCLLMCCMLSASFLVTALASETPAVSASIMVGDSTLTNAGYYTSVDGAEWTSAASAENTNCVHWDGTSLLTLYGASITGTSYGISFNGDLTINGGSGASTITSANHAIYVCDGNLAFNGTMGDIVSTGGYGISVENGSISISGTVGDILTEEEKSFGIISSGSSSGITIEETASVNSITAGYVGMSTSAVGDIEIKSGGSVGDISVGMRAITAGKAFILHSGASIGDIKSDSYGIDAHTEISIDGTIGSGAPGAPAIEIGGGCCIDSYGPITIGENARIGDLKSASGRGIYSADQVEIKAGGSIGNITSGSYGVAVFGGGQLVISGEIGGIMSTAEDAIYAQDGGNIIIDGKVGEIVSGGYAGIHGGSIALSGEIGSIKAVAGANTYGNALFAYSGELFIDTPLTLTGSGVYDNSYAIGSVGAITLGDGIKIDTPNNGIFGEYNISSLFYTVLENGIPANHVVLVRKYDVTFDSAGGSPVIAAEVVPGGTVARPADPTRDGYQFVEWVTEEGFKYDFNTPVTGNITLYADWTPKYTLSYHANGGEGELPAPASVVGGGTVVVSEGTSLGKAGYIFAGWNTAADGSGTAYRPGESLMIQSDLILYAQWRVGGCTLQGTIKGHKDIEYVSVVAWLENWEGAIYTAEIGPAYKASDGKLTYWDYSISAPAGNYNLFVEATTLEGKYQLWQNSVKLKKDTEKRDVNLQPGQIKILAEGENEVVVGGLDAIALQSLEQDTVDSVEVEFTVSEVAPSSPSVSEIQGTASGQTLEFMDVTIEKTETTGGSSTKTQITDTGDIAIEILVPFDKTGKDDITVYRHHENAVDKLTENANGDGERIEIADDHIAIHAKKFSTYAIGYTIADTPSSPSVTPMPGGGSNYTPSYQIIAPSDVLNGQITVSATQVKAGKTVTITVVPDEDYELESLTVTDRNGKELELTDKGSGTYTFRMPSGRVTVDASFQPIPEPEPETLVNPFADIAEGTYFYDAVLWAVDQGITNGTSATTFSPDVDCTREQIVTLLWRAADSPEPATTNCPFTDVDMDSYYGKAVLWAVEQGITTGTSADTFSPDVICTRAQIVTFLWRFMGN